VIIIATPGVDLRRGTRSQVPAVLPRRTSADPVQELPGCVIAAVRVHPVDRAETASRQIRTLATTHSPAILNALEGADHDAVIVCDRIPQDGGSRLRRLVDLPGYPELMAAGRLGAAVSQGRLVDAAEERPRSYAEFDRLLEAL
jgi:hypothetical protein